MDVKWLLAGLLLLAAASAIDIQITANGVDPTTTRVNLASGGALNVVGSLYNPSAQEVSITGYRITTNPSALRSIIEEATGQSLSLELNVPITMPAGERLPLNLTFTVPELPLPAGNYDLILTMDTNAGSQSWTFLLSVPSRGIIDSIIGTISGIILWFLSLFTGG